MAGRMISLVQAQMPLCIHVLLWLSALQSCSSVEFMVCCMRVPCNGMKPAVVRTYVNRVCLRAADKTSQFVRQLLEPAFITVPAAIDIPALFQSALHMTGTLPFPVPDVFYESHRLQNEDMEFYLAPVSKSGAITFSSAIHTVLCKQFPAGQRWCKQVNC